MKKITALAGTLAFVAAILMTSCHALEGGLNLSSQDRVDKGAISAITKYLDEDIVVYEINFLCAIDPFNYSANSVIVTYSEPGSDEVKSHLVGFQYDTEKEEKPFSTYKNRTPDTGIPLKDIDLSQVAANIAKGQEIMKEADIKPAGLYSYEVKVKSPEEVVHEFDLTQKGETKTTARGTETTYYKYEFHAHDGEVHFVE